ncbi:hypothetical protein NL676_028473 [Syzygium grande]|nr:hypothetical protein NL676_028473 [Syzygium grande]
MNGFGSSSLQNLETSASSITPPHIGIAIAIAGEALSFNCAREDEDNTKIRKHSGTIHLKKTKNAILVIIQDN